MEEQLIEELLMEAADLGIYNAVIDASEKYINQGLTPLAGLKHALYDLTFMEDAPSDLQEIITDLPENDENENLFFV